MRHRFSHRPLVPLLLAAAALALDADAAPRTFTAKDGRTMEAELISYRGDKLKVRRTDTDREFTLALSSLAPTDQQELRKFLADHPELREKIPATAFRVEYSKARTDTERDNGSYYDTSVENWGYGITLVNLTNAPLEGLRIDYIVFAEPDPDGAFSTTPRSRDKPLERLRGTLAYDPVPVQGKSLLRTQTFACRTGKLDGGRWVTNEGLKRKLRDRVIHGVWFRVYDGETLVQETSSPEALRTSERWGGDSERRETSSAN